MTRYIDMINFEKLSKEELLKAFQAYAEYEANKLCSSCKHGCEEDGDVFDCYMSRDYFGYDHIVLPKDYGCNKWSSKDER